MGIRPITTVRPKTATVGMEQRARLEVRRCTKARTAEATATTSLATSTAAIKPTTHPKPAPSGFFFASVVCGHGEQFSGR